MKKSKSQSYKIHKRKDYVLINFISEYFQDVKFSIKLYLTDLKYIIRQYGKDKDSFTNSLDGKAEIHIFQNFETVIFRFIRPDKQIDFCLPILKIVELEKTLK